MAVRYPGQTDEGTTPARDPESHAPAARVPDARVPEAAPSGATSPLAHPPRLARHTPAPAAVVRAMEIACSAPPAAVPLVREALALALPGIPVTVAEARVPEVRAPEASEPAAEASLAPAWAALRRTRQQVAQGEAAAGLQHALANPLTALLFEAQLLQMEALPPALAEAVGRIVTQCRRTIEVARRLDAAGATAAPSPAAGSARHDIRNPL